MTTIVNTPQPVPAADNSGGIGMIIGVVVLLVVGYLFFIYGLPAVRQMSGPQINIPDKIDVTVNQEK